MTGYELAIFLDLPAGIDRFGRDFILFGLGQRAAGDQHSFGIGFGNQHGLRQKAARD